MPAYQLPKGGAGIDALVKIERPNSTPSYRSLQRNGITGRWLSRSNVVN
jgi:hypothetical protein